VYSNAGNTIVVTFPRPTNTPGLGSCSSLLQPPSLNLIDTQSSACIWRTTSQLVLTSSNIPTVGSTIQFIPNVIVDALNPLFNVSNTVSVVVEAPDAPIAPTAVVISPDEVAQCDDLTLDGSASFGGGLRDLIFSWSLISTDPSDNALKLLISSASNSTLVIPASSFPAITGSSKMSVFQLTVTSSFGVSSAPVLRTVTRFADSRVRLFIEGLPMRTHVSTEALKLQGRVKFASCTPVASQSSLVLTWAQISGPSPRRASATGANSAALFPREFT
jgi:hypothetical protein